MVFSLLGMENTELIDLLLEAIHFPDARCWMLDPPARPSNRHLDRSGRLESMRWVTILDVLTK